MVFHEEKTIIGNNKTFFILRRVLVLLEVVLLFIALNINDLRAICFVMR